MNTSSRRCCGARNHSGSQCRIATTCNGQRWWWSTGTRSRECLTNEQLDHQTEQMSTFVGTTGVVGFVFDPNAAALMESKVLREGITAEERSLSKGTTAQRHNPFIERLHHFRVHLGAVGSLAAMKGEHPIGESQKGLRLLLLASW